ncbi:hypothetical protein FQN49_004743 [Arthroderma sp. PD_2]|nr:hypothetical protein FQN49_004743 [Arthroderma sp. PD_2]
MSVRRPSHAGSWYSDNGPMLQNQIDKWMEEVPDTLDGLGSLPVPGARMIIAPHAGYAYSGPCAAYAYKCLDLSKAKRIFLIGPSHHQYLTTIALPELTGYRTPLSSSPLPVDTTVLSELRATADSSGSAKRFTTMSASVDEAEHSLELHLPYIHRLLQRLYPSQPTSAYPPLVPMMVGSTSAATEQIFGSLLAPYLADEDNAFIISSDFCHWGTRFGYTYYTAHPSASSTSVNLPLTYPSLPVPSAGLTSTKAAAEVEAVSSGQMLKSDKTHRAMGGCRIHESISACDIACMSAIASGDTDVFLDALRRTGNTVCGRHPIGVVMAGLEGLREEEDQGEGACKGKFYFMRYERSSDCFSVSDSSVSYVSAFAVL